MRITRGFRAVYEARGWSQPSGSDLLDTFYRKPPLLASQYLTEEVTERLDYRGEVVTPLDEGSLRTAVQRLRDKGVEAIAVCFLFSFLNPAHERRTAKIVAEEAPNCAEAGVLGVLPGTIGLLQATEAIKLILGIGAPLIGRLLCYDALASTFRELRLPRDPKCPGCGADAEFHGYEDLEQRCAAS